MVLIRDFINYTHSALNMILEPVWKLLTIHLPVYIHAVCYERELERAPGEAELQYVRCPFLDTTAFEDDEPGIEGMTRQLIDLITTLIVNPAIHSLIRTGLGPFTATLCSYLLLPQSQLENYRYNPLYFLEEVDAAHGEASTEINDNVRALCTRILETLIETFGGSTIETLQSIMLESMAYVASKHKPLVKPVHHPTGKKPGGKEASAYDSVSIYEYVSDPYDRHDSWRKNELGLYLLSFLSDDLFVSLEKGQKMVNVGKIVECLQSLCAGPMIRQHPLLLGRLLSAGAEAVQLLPKGHPIGGKLLELSYESLRSDVPDSVKFIACKSLVRYAHHIQAMPIKDPCGAVRAAEKLQAGNDFVTIHISIETVATVFLYGQPKILVPALRDVVRFYLNIFLENTEGDAHEFVDLIQKLCKQTQYVAPLVDCYVPLMTPIMERYPKTAEPSFIRVCHARDNSTDSRCWTSLTCWRESASRRIRRMSDLWTCCRCSSPRSTPVSTTSHS